MKKSKKIVEDIEPRYVRARVGRNDWQGRYVQLVLHGQNYKGGTENYYAMPQWIQMPESPGSMMGVCCSFDPEAAQSLMDDLWNLGIRPTSEGGSVGALSATREHLKDMRSIAFDLMKTRLTI